MSTGNSGIQSNESTPAQETQAPTSERAEARSPRALDAARAQRVLRSGSVGRADVLALQRMVGNRTVRTLLARRASHGIAPEVESAIERKRGGGQALDGQSRAQMESAFASDFSGVRLHADAESDALNRAVNAVAFTTGRDIFFSQGAHNPETSAGRKLLAHELTHVVQQGGSGSVQGKLVLSEPGDRYEQEADAAAEWVAREPFESLQRQCACGAASQVGDECESCKRERKGDAPIGSIQRAVDSLLQRDDNGQQPPGEQPPSPQPTSESPGTQPPSESQPASAKLTIPLKQKVVEGSYPVSLKYAELKFTITVEVAAQIEAGAPGESEPGSSQETGITPVGFDSGDVALGIAHSWVKKDGFNFLGWNTAFTELKLEGGIKTKDGLEVNLAGSGKLACGVELELELHLIKIKEDWKVEGPGAEAKADIPWVPFDIPIASGVKLSNVQLHPIVKIEVTPNYEQILGEVAKDVGEDIAGEQALEKAGQAATALVGADALIVGGMLLGGVAAIGATVLAYKDADDIAATHGECITLADKLTQGFRIGAAGGAPPSEKEMMPGYTKGIQNFNTALATLKQKNANAEDATLKAAIAAQADAAAAEAGPQIKGMAQDTVWTKYASSHQDTWYHSYDFDRWAAWANIYGGDPMGDPRYTRYCPNNVCEHGMR